MKKSFNVKNMWKRLNAPIPIPFSFSALLDWIPWPALSVIAALALAEFGLWPIMVLIPTMRHCSFDHMVDWNRDLLDKALFPLVAWLSIALYALALAKSLREKRSLLAPFRRNPTVPLFLAMAVWMTANIPLTNGMTYCVMHGAGLKHESFPLVLEYFLCFFPLGLFLRNQRLKLWLLRGLTVVSVILASCSFYLHDNLTCSPNYYDWAPSYSTVFTNLNYYGYFLAVFVSLSAALMAGAESRRWRAFYAVALTLNTVVLSYNHTRGAWIGALCACLFLAAARRVLDGKFTLRALAPLVLFVLALCLTGAFNGELLSSFVRLFQDVNAIANQPDTALGRYSGFDRWTHWKHSLALIRQNPIVGIGYEGIHVRNLQFVGNPRPHNEFIQYALFYGIPGGLLYIASCASVYVRAFRRRTRLDSLTLAALTAAFGYLVSSFFGLTVYNTAPYLFIMLGLGYAWGGEENVADNAPGTQSADSASETE